MRKNLSIQAASTSLKVLTPNQIAQVKGGASLAAIRTVSEAPTNLLAPANVVNILEDDKRRERPGGGASTQ